MPYENWSELLNYAFEIIRAYSIFAYHSLWHWFLVKTRQINCIDFFINFTMLLRRLTTYIESIILSYWFMQYEKFTDKLLVIQKSFFDDETAIIGKKVLGQSMEAFWMR